MAKNNVNVSEALNEMAFETTKKYYQIMKDEFGVEFSYAFSVNEDGSTVYHEKIVSMTDCDERFGLSCDLVDTTVDIVPSERNEYLAKLTAALKYAKAILNLANEAESVGFVFSCCDIEKRITGANNMRPVVWFFNAARGDEQAFVCDKVGLKVFNTLVYHRLSLKFLAEKVYDFSRRGVCISVDPDSYTYAFVFDPELIYPNFWKFEDKLRSFCTEHKDYFGPVKLLPQKRSELESLKTMVNEISFGIENCTVK